MAATNAVSVLSAIVGKETGTGDGTFSIEGNLRIK